MNTDDLSTLAHEIRHFLGKGGWLPHISGMAKLYLEFPDVGIMYDFHRQLMLALDPVMVRVSSDTIRRIDDETIEIEVGGISVILTCKQRFKLSDGNSTGYGNIQFNMIKGLRPE